MAFFEESSLGGLLMTEKIVLTRTSEMPETRSMTRKQAKEFNAKGLNPLRNTEMIQKIRKEEWDAEDSLFSLKLNDDMVEWILENVYPEFDFDNADQKLSDTLAIETYNKTFVSNAEIKN
jgi:hypothetical protein